MYEPPVDPNFEPIMVDGVALHELIGQSLAEPMVKAIRESGLLLEGRGTLPCMAIPEHVLRGDGHFSYSTANLDAETFREQMRRMLP